MEHRMDRRNFLRLSVLGVVGGILAGCAPASPPAAPTAAPGAAEAPAAAEAPEATAAPAEQKIEIRWLDWSDQDDANNAAIARFKERFPNVTVNFEPIGDQWGDKQLTQMVSGTAPDVLTGNDDTSYTWAEKGQLLDLNPLVDKDLTEEQIDDFFAHQWDGLVYPATKIRMGLPYYTWVYQYYYNKDALDEVGVPYPKAGWTTDDYSTAIEKLTTKDANGKVTRWGGIDTCYEIFRIQLWLRMFDGHMVDPDDWTQCALSSEGSKAALEWHRHRLFDTNTLVQTAQMEKWGGLDPLAQGKVAIMGGGSGDAFTLLDNPPKFQWAIAAPPIGSSGKPTGIGTMDNWGIWKGTKAPDVAWAWVKMLACEDEFEEAFSVRWGVTPNRKTLLPKFKQAMVQQHGIADDQIDGQFEMLKAGYCKTGEMFKDQKGSKELITPILEKILIVGGAAVSEVDSVCDEVSQLNQE